MSSLPVDDQIREQTTSSLINPAPPFLIAAATAIVIGTATHGPMAVGFSDPITIISVAPSGTFLLGVFVAIPMFIWGGWLVSRDWSKSGAVGLVAVGLLVAALGAGWRLDFTLSGDCTADFYPPACVSPPPDNQLLTQASNR